MLFPNVISTDHTFDIIFKWASDLGIAEDPVTAFISVAEYNPESAAEDDDNVD